MRMMMVMLRGGVIGMLPMHSHVEFRGGDSVPLNTLGRQRYAIQVEACDGIRHGVERAARVEQRADGHVATDA
jgi:hypothetical protein